MLTVRDDHSLLKVPVTHASLVGDGCAKTFAPNASQLLYFRVIIRNSFKAAIAIKMLRLRKEKVKRKKEIKSP